MKKIIATSIVLLLLFLSCQNSKKEVKNFLTPSLKVKLNQALTKEACLSCLCIIGEYIENGTKYISFIDYHPGTIYIYNSKTNLFEYKFQIPKTCNIADVSKMINTDSIIYFNNQKGVLTVCDTQKIKSEYFPINFYSDPNIIFTYYHNLLRKMGDKMIFDVTVAYNDNTKSDYYKRINSTPILGLFEFENGKLKHTPLALYNQVKASDSAEIPDNHIVFTTNESENLIIFSHKCSNSIFTYNVKTKATSEHIPSNTEKDITPIYYNRNIKSDSSNDPYTIAVNKQNICSDIIFNKKTNSIFRIINIIENGEYIRYLQVLNLDFEVIIESPLPKEFVEIVEFQGDILLHTTDRKKREIIYEKFNFNN